MATKAEIFNLALGALLLQRQIIDAENDPSTEAKVLRTHFQSALVGALEDMDLDSTATTQALELVLENPFPQWAYAYKYPDDCAYFRRISNNVLTDNRLTRIPYRIAVVSGQKVILTNEFGAVGEYVSTEIPLDGMAHTAIRAIALRLASYSAPLATGKGARQLMEDIREEYKVTKMEAKQKDAEENFQFLDPETESEFAAARLGDY